MNQMFLNLKLLAVLMLLVPLYPEQSQGTMPFKNTTFQEVMEDNRLLPSGWAIMGDDCEDKMHLDRHHDDAPIKLRISIDDTHGAQAVCGISQRVDAESLKGQILHMTIQMESHGETPSEAGMWVRVDPPEGNFLTFRRALLEEDVQNQRNQKLSARFPIYLGASSVGFGFYLQGKGDISISNLHIAQESMIEPISPVALEYLSEIHQILQENSINSANIDWNDFWQDTLLDARGIQKIEDLHQVVPQILWRLGDGHSHFRPAISRRVAAQPSEDSKEPNIAGHLLNQRIGYLWMAGVSGEESLSQAYANYLHTKVRKLADGGAIAWIIDLRGNGGGNMWPMLAGIGPILGDGVVGGFVDPDDKIRRWEVSYGESRLDGEIRSAIHNPVTPTGALETQPVAILAGRTTASSGEAVIVAFRCRDRVKQFGSQTRGLTTANNGFELSDGSLIALTVSTFADSCGTIYGEALSPGQEEKPSEIIEPSFDDPAVDAALNWLVEQLNSSVR